MLRIKSLRRLCLAGIISPILYMKLKNGRKFRNKLPSYDFSRPLKLSKFTEDDCLLLFRFSKHEIHRLIQALEIPNMFKTGNGTVTTGLEGLCIVLRRLSYPNRLSDLCRLFHRDATSLSRIFNCVLKFIYENHAYLITRIMQPWMDNTTLEEFAEACTQKGSYYHNVMGFIDGTCRPICRPKYRQKLQYSGYKKMHLLKYHSIVFPNGLIGRLDGPFNGHRHDSAILRLSRIKNEMIRVFEKRGYNYSVYGDVGYANQRYIKVGYKHYNALTIQQKNFNKDMAALRISVEYGFGKILQQFAYLDFRKNQKMYLNNLKLQYFVAAILVNCQACFRGNQISEYFYCTPPTLEKYLSGI